MQATIEIKCRRCLKYLGQLNIDTADMPDELQDKINKKILDHRQACFRYEDSNEYLNGQE
jgi:hypothetical protein